MTPDKYYHAGGSFLLCEAGMLAVNDNTLRYTIMPAMALGIGFLKEYTDPRFSREDIKADLVGIGSAMLFDFVIRKVILKR